MREVFPINLNVQQVDDLVVTCADHRFQGAFVDLMESRAIERADRLAVPAPSKAIAGKVILPSIVKLKELHDFTSIHIMDHVDCGGFGGLEAFDGQENLEAAEHFRILKAAKAVLHETFPDIAVSEYVVGTHGEITSLEFPFATLEDINLSNLAR